MKYTFIEVPIYVIIIFIALTIIGKNFSKTYHLNFYNVRISDVRTCIGIDKCILDAHISLDEKNTFSPIKKIKVFIRQKIY